VRILVTGAGGQLGTDLVRTCEAAGDDVIAADRARLDVTDRDAVYGAILGSAPDVVVHAGAWTAVDACESDPDRALAVNSLGTQWVADAARRSGAHLVAISTDYVFDGTKAEAYHEWDQPNPQSSYGRSKWAGEQAVWAQAAGSCVVRTSWVCGAHGHNMVKTVLGLRDRPELAFVDDQRGRPSFTADLAPAIRELAAARVCGTFHLTNEGATTWYGFVQDVLAVAGDDPAKVRPITTAELDPPRPAPRPANSELDGLARRLHGFAPLPHYRDSLDRLVSELLEG
jgi:dTDP-4-dehydrorhamnose reductase